ncbi:hypothetical protein FRC17_004625 [Serendipita sp. 399]|nr:hypothetical protein FRC17_004625 [Serendipita sp. 399]
MLEGPAWIHGNYVPTMDEMMEYQATREAWEVNIKYGRYTVYFCAVSLAIFFLVRWIKLLIFWTRLNGGPPIVPTKLIALLRLLTYPRLPYPIAKIVNVVWTIGPLGPNILLFIALVYTNLWCWVNEYYYRPPFCISHDKLQMFHQGVSFLIVYFSMVHTVSMIVQSKMELPWTQVYVSDPVYWTGFAALGPLIWLYIGSLPIARKALYEGFYLLHICAAIIFVAFLWKHGFTYLDTDAYMKATLILFGFGFLTRFFFMVLTNVLFRHRAKLSLQSGSIRITVPTNLKWSPGMHIFIRFLHVRPLESHPFTISSLPTTKGEERENELVFFVRPESGFTRTLADVAGRSPPEKEFPIILDGPYGESAMNPLRAYDSVLLLAGGTGITFIVPLLSDLVSSMKAKNSLCKTIDLVWTVKDIQLIKSFESAILEAQQTARSVGGTVSVQIHVTSRSRGSEEAQLESSPSEKKASDEGDDHHSDQLELAQGAHRGRPNIPSIVASKSTTWTGHAAVAVCGPLSFMTDTSNAVAGVQLDILRGRSTCHEMHLRSETFGW